MMTILIRFGAKSVVRLSVASMFQFTILQVAEWWTIIHLPVVSSQKKRKHSSSTDEQVRLLN